jgi:hypothetical protein
VNEIRVDHCHIKVDPPQQEWELPMPRGPMMIRCPEADCEFPELKKLSREEMRGAYEAARVALRNER